MGCGCGAGHAGTVASGSWARSGSTWAAARLAAAGLEVPAGDAERLERDLALHLERVAALAAAADLTPRTHP